MKKYPHYIDLQGEVLPAPHRNNITLSLPKDFVLKMSAYYVCCIYSSALKTRFGFVLFAIQAT